VKNSKKLLLLAVAMTSAATGFLSNACETNTDISIVPFESVFVDAIILQPVDGEGNKYKPHWAQLFEDCYRHNDVQACQQLGVLMAYKMLHERQFSAETIRFHEKTNATLIESLDLSNERERRRTERINKRRQTRETEQKWSGMVC